MATIGSRTERLNGHIGTEIVILQNDISKSYSDLGNIETIISEYGEKHISTAISKYFLIEHGEKLIENKAVQLLSTVF